MAKKGNISKLFVLGVVLALVVGFIQWLMKEFAGTTEFTPWLGLILVIIGLIVGFANISSKEAQVFMLSGTILVLVPFLSAGVFAELWFIPYMFASLLMFFTPAVIVVAIKEVWRLAEAK